MCSSKRPSSLVCDSPVKFALVPFFKCKITFEILHLVTDNAQFAEKPKIHEWTGVEEQIRDHCKLSIETRWNNSRGRAKASAKVCVIHSACGRVARAAKHHDMHSCVLYASIFFNVQLCSGRQLGTSFVFVLCVIVLLCCVVDCVVVLCSWCVKRVCFLLQKSKKTHADCEVSCCSCVFVFVHRVCLFVHLCLCVCRYIECNPSTAKWSRSTTASYWGLCVLLCWQYKSKQQYKLKTTKNNKNKTQHSNTGR